jgi:hypothetical protein
VGPPPHSKQRKYTADELSPAAIGEGSKLTVAREAHPSGCQR